MRKVHPELAYQARELEGQIEGILGDPPDRKNYQRMIDALVEEYASGGGIDGFLIGHASTNAQSFGAIVKAVT